MSRPSLYSPELVEAICARMGEGEPLAQICRTEGYPHPSTIRDWMAANEQVTLAIARARADGFDAIAVECLRIADTPVEAFMEEQERREKPKPADAGDDYVPEFEFVEVKRSLKDAIEHRRLQIDTRLKLLAKWDPKRYGDRVQVTGDPEHPVAHTVNGTIAIDPGEAYLRMLKGD
jgi:hypothetical protein